MYGDQRHVTIAFAVIFANAGETGYAKQMKRLSLPFANVHHENPV